MLPGGRDGRWAPWEGPTGHRSRNRAAADCPVAVCVPEGSGSGAEGHLPSQPPAAAGRIRNWAAALNQNCAGVMEKRRARGTRALIQQPLSRKFTTYWQLLQRLFHSRFCTVSSIDCYVSVCV